MRATDINPDYLKRHGIETPKRQQKYGAQPTEYNGKTYPSRLEANCRAMLDGLQAAGLVTSITEQVRFDLPGGLRYTADFVVEYATGLPRTIEAKGKDTRDYVMRRKLYHATYPERGPLDVVRHWRDVPAEGRPEASVEP